MDIRGTIRQIRFHNEENGYSVLMLETEDGPIIAVGTAFVVSEGMDVALTGELVFHERFGEQFAFTSIEAKEPTTPEAIEHFLASGVYRGIGEVMASRIVRHFGEETLEIMDHHIERLLEVPGIGRKTLEKIKDSVEEESDMRDHLLALADFGITLQQARKILNCYREDTVAVLTENPYRLVRDIDGIGFRKADAIAMKAGLPHNSPARIGAAIDYALLEARELEGHTYLPVENLTARVMSLTDTERKEVREVLYHAIFEGRIRMVRPYPNEVRVYAREMLRAENYVAQKLSRMLEGAAEDGEWMARYLERYEADHEITFSDGQKDALIESVKARVFILTGGPGTGKTTITKLVTEYEESLGKTVLLAAPTGRAAKRLAEATGREASTLHRLIGIRPGEKPEHDAKNPIDVDTLIVDETSMLDLMLADKLLRALTPATKLIFVGDADQLPAVGAGNVLADLINAGIPYRHLYEIFRQGRDSDIILSAHRVNAGKLPVANRENGDFFHYRTAKPEKILETVAALVKERLPKAYGFDPVTDIQVLAPAKKGALGVANLNESLQNALNPARGTEMRHLNRTFRVGDKVMQTKNDYDIEWTKDGEEGSGVMNGEIGIVTYVDTETKSLLVDFDGALAELENKRLENLDLSYASTVHKAQGSEFPAVIVVMGAYNDLLYTKNLLYTAITRARKLVILMGSDEIIARTVANTRIGIRYSGLAERYETVLRRERRLHALRPKRQHQRNF